MLKIHTTDGLTTRIDITDKEQTKEWLKKMNDQEFQNTISAITIAHKGVQYSLPRPSGFSKTFFQVERIESDPSRKIKGGERIVCMADGVRIVMMVHRAQRAVRVSVIKTGKQRFNPKIDQLIKENKHGSAR